MAPMLVRLPGHVKLSPTRTVQNWIDLQADKLVGTDPETWDDILKHYFHGRLESRYLKPIRKIQAAVPGEKLGEGEGFAIVVLQCSLIEFLQSCYDGSNYRYEAPFGPNDYDDSQEKFTAFFKEHEPFKTEFIDDLPTRFYFGIRCGLLHEARTKGKWLIHDYCSNGRILGPDRRTLYRDNLQQALEGYIAGYGATVRQCSERQLAFIRKFEALTYE